MVRRLGIVRLVLSAVTQLTGWTNQPPARGHAKPRWPRTRLGSQGRLELTDESELLM
jgi:hypothetical protein